MVPVLVDLILLNMVRTSFKTPACAPHRPEGELLSPRYDEARWAALLASDPVVAAGAERLRPFGEPYVGELAAHLLEPAERPNPAPVIDDLLQKAKAIADLVADTPRFDAFVAHFDPMFRTVRGIVGQAHDGTALAQVGDDYRLFASLAVYRQVYDDEDPWDEMTNLDDKRRFLAVACRYLPKLEKK